MEWWFYVMVACIAFYMVNVLLLLGRLKDQATRQELYTSRLIELLEIIAERDEANVQTRRSLLRPVLQKTSDNPSSRLEG
jgi:hypothetical protein